MGIKVKNKEKAKAFIRARRVHRVRAVLHGTAERPRLVVERTLRHMRAQLINDDAGKTLAAAADIELAKDNKIKGKTEVAAAVGKLLAEKAAKVGVSLVIFDRRSYRYHGRVKALADGARAGGLKF